MLSTNKNGPQNVADFFKAFYNYGHKRTIIFAIFTKRLMTTEKFIFLPLLQLKSLNMWLSFLLKFNTLWFLFNFTNVMLLASDFLLAEDIIRSSIIF